MIFWSDFIFDEVLGPILGWEGSDLEAGGGRTEKNRSIRIDASNQETSRRAALARMVGASTHSTTSISTEAEPVRPSPKPE